MDDQGILVSVYFLGERDVNVSFSSSHILTSTINRTALNLHNKLRRHQNHLTHRSLAHLLFAKHYLIYFSDFSHLEEGLAFIGRPSGRLSSAA